MNTGLVCCAEGGCFQNGLLTQRHAKSTGLRTQRGHSNHLYCWYRYFYYYCDLLVKNGPTPSTNPQIYIYTYWHWEKGKFRLTAVWKIVSIQRREEKQRNGFRIFSKLKFRWHARKLDVLLFSYLYLWICGTDLAVDEVKAINLSGKRNCTKCLDNCSRHVT